MRNLYILSSILYLGACSNTDNTEPAMDCRQERFTCSEGFECAQDDSGAYDCRELDGSEPLLDGGVDTDSTTPISDAQMSTVDATLVADAAVSAPTDAEVSSSDSGAADAGDGAMLTPGEPYLLSNTPEV